ncbi:3-phenylpropionate/cinnamic acid dioxygenase subunit beta [Nocardia fluminea]|uniref:3-phenylpropionate/cinnamic acid dioxygenase subunit beta n=1 Tax=Nocardia fluminea TaxID=134984 RepID=UPI0033DE9F89
MTATSDPLAGSLADVLLHHEISQFLYREAKLLTERKYDQWLSLMAEDLHYYMPIRKNLHPRLPETTEGPLALALFDDDKAFLTQRVAKIATGVSWSEDPLSRVTYVVSNVLVDPAEHADEYEVYSAFVLQRNRLEDEADTYTGVRYDLLRRTSEGLRIARRHIRLDQSVILTKNMSVFF